MRTVFIELFFPGIGVADEGEREPVVAPETAVGAPHLAQNFDPASIALPQELQNAITLRMNRLGGSEYIAAGEEAGMLGEVPRAVIHQAQSQQQQQPEKHG